MINVSLVHKHLYIFTFPCVSYVSSLSPIKRPSVHLALLEKISFFQDELLHFCSLCPGVVTIYAVILHHLKKSFPCMEKFSVPSKENPKKNRIKIVIKIC